MRALGLALALASSAALGQVQLPDGYLSAEGVNGASISPTCTIATQTTNTAISVKTNSSLAFDGTACGVAPTISLSNNGTNLVLIGAGFSTPNVTISGNGLINDSIASGNNALVVTAGARINLNNGTDYLFDSSGVATFNGQIATASTTTPQFQCTGAASCAFSGASGQQTQVNSVGTSSVALQPGNGVVVNTGVYQSTQTSGNQFACTGAAACRFVAADGQSIVIGSTSAVASSGAGSVANFDSQPGGAGSGATPGGNAGAISIVAGAAGAGGSTGAAGSPITSVIQSAAGGAAGSSTGAAGAGSNLSLQSGTGGAGSASLAAAAGGTIQITSGAGGTNGGGGGASSGDVNIQTGTLSGAAAAGVIRLGDGNAGSPASTIFIGTSTTTTPVKIAGGSGAFVSSAALNGASPAVATFTVPTGAKCVCSDQTTQTTSVKCSVSGTTATVTGPNASTDTVTIICL